MSKNILKEEVLSITANELDKIWDKLSLNEQKIVYSVRNNNQKQIFNKVKLIDRLTESLSKPKDKSMIRECVKRINEQITVKPIKEVTYKVFDLYEVVTKLLEDEYKGPAVVKLPDFKYLKNVRMSVEDNPESPDTIFVEFNVTFYPVGVRFAELHNNVADLNKKWIGIGRSILNQAIHWPGRAGIDFSGQGIWDTLMRTEGARPGRPIVARGEIALYTVQNKENPKSFIDFRKPLLEILADLDRLIGTKWFVDEISKENQKEQNALLKGEKYKEPEGEKQLGDVSQLSDEELEKLIAKQLKSTPGKFEVGENVELQEIVNIADDEDAKKTIQSVISGLTNAPSFTGDALKTRLTNTKAVLDDLIQYYTKAGKMENVELTEHKIEDKTFAELQEVLDSLADSLTRVSSSLSTYQQNDNPVALMNAESRLLKIKSDAEYAYSIVSREHEAHSNEEVKENNELVEAPTYSVTGKDEMRISDIMTKASGDQYKARRLAQIMADKITDRSKAARRAKAAEDENYHDIANIFYRRYLELTKQN